MKQRTFGNAFGFKRFIFTCVTSNLRSQRAGAGAQTQVLDMHEEDHDEMVRMVRCVPSLEISFALYHVYRPDSKSGEQVVEYQAVQRQKYRKRSTWLTHAPPQSFIVII